MSSNPRSQLIAAGMKLYPQYGYAKLSVRVLAAEAGVSPGMFHHLFASKDAFMAELLENNHQDTFGRLNMDDADAENPFAGLREVLRRLMLCLRDNLGWVQRTFADSGEGVAVVADFWQRHFRIFYERLMALLNRCAPAEMAEQEHRLAYLTGAVAAPMVIGTRMREVGVLPAYLDARLPEINEDTAIVQRIDWALQALFPNQPFELPTRQQEQA